MWQVCESSHFRIKIRENRVSSIESLEWHHRDPFENQEKKRSCSCFSEAVLVSFYEDVEPSEEGMLGGFLEISEVDLEQSRRFLSRFIVSHTHTRTSTHTHTHGQGRGLCRCGRGLCRCISSRFSHSTRLVFAALPAYAHEEYLGDDADRYDVVWMQWVPVSHLTDRDLCNFLVKCKRSLRPNGVIILKDNMARHGCKLDPVDSSISRHLDVMKTIIYKAELEVVGVERQQGFPEVMMPVWMLALRPARSPDKPK
uniref:Methyltransferase like 11B n=1 Tax=Neogobius melanostomus TaxID=47308 RepID=A0A8C6WDX0_9GOBI